NGVWTANDPHPDPHSNYSAYGTISCEQGFKLGNYRWDDRLRARRFPLVDEEKGIVLAAGFIDHAGRLVTYLTSDGVKHESPMKSPHSFCFLETFKIIDGKIRHAEAIFITVPYNMPSPWVKLAGRRECIFVDFSNQPTMRGFFAPTRFEADVYDLEVGGEVPTELNGAFVRLGGDWLYPPKFDDDSPFS